MRDKNESQVRQWQLPFHDESQMWTAFPESTRADCRALFIQLLTECLKREERSENERQD
jgi:hypothetical protein